VTAILGRREKGSAVPVIARARDAKGHRAPHLLAALRRNSREPSALFVARITNRLDAPAAR
jgi:hypothetical protein